MECKHLYYHYIGGQLVCAQCGEPSPNPTTTIEDKIDTVHETKEKMWPAEVKRQKKAVTKGKGSKKGKRSRP